MTSVDRLRPGTRARVTAVNGLGAIRQRLLDMGVLPYTLIQVERRAPAGDPVWIRVDGTQVSLRRLEAATVLVVEL